MPTPDADTLPVKDLASPAKVEETPLKIVSQVKRLWHQTDDLPQRSNALFEFQEANKALFPARFNPADRFRGRLPKELKTGQDTRRVQTPVIFRGVSQLCAMVAPSDMDFTWNPAPRVKPPEAPLLAPPVPDPEAEPTQQFAASIETIERLLLGEIDFTNRIKAWVQDALTYPAGIVKFYFKRDYQTSLLSSCQPSDDLTDNVARMESLMRAYADKEFTQDDARFAEMMDLIASLSGQAELKKHYGLVLEIKPLDSFGISEDAVDKTDIYSSAFMFDDALLTVAEVRARYPYKVAEDGTPLGLHKDEESGLQASDPNAGMQDARNKTKRTRGRASNSRPINTGSRGGIETKEDDPDEKLVLVREIWHKRNGRVYVLARGLDHFLDSYVPQKRPRQWYPYRISSPLRVPGELYGASIVELSRDIQDRIHRKRSDEEKSRWLGLPRGFCDTALVDDKEMVKMQDVDPGQIRGINTGGKGLKASDLIAWSTYVHDPEGFNVAQDERDMQRMMNLPDQAMGMTGSANYATEVQVAAQGNAIGIQDFQGVMRRDIEGLLQALAEILLQELTPEEAIELGGPFTLWPEVYDDAEALRIKKEETEAAMQTVAPIVLQDVVMAMQSGSQLSAEEVHAKIMAAAAPVVEERMIARFGRPEPMTREALLHRLRVKVSVSFNGTMDRQSRVQNMAMLAEAVMQMGQAAQVSGLAFRPKPLLKKMASLLDEDQGLEAMFPEMPMGAPGAPPAPGGAPAGSERNPSTPAEQGTKPAIAPGQGTV